MRPPRGEGATYGPELVPLGSCGPPGPVGVRILAARRLVMLAAPSWPARIGFLEPLAVAGEVEAPRRVYSPRSVA